MSASQRRVLALVPIGDDPEVGRWLAALQDSRDRTLREIDALDPAALDASPHPILNTIGELLYHVALIEADWLLSDILGLPDEAWPAWIEDEFPIDARDASGRLARVPNEPLSRHLERLARVRTLLIDELSGLTADELDRRRPMPDYDIAPAYALHHLLQHEAEHRAHIAFARDALR